MEEFDGQFVISIQAGVMLAMQFSELWWGCGRPILGFLTFKNMFVNVYSVFSQMK